CLHSLPLANSPSQPSVNISRATKMVSDIGTIRLVVEDIGEAVTRNINGAQILHELLSAPWLHALLKIYECLIQFQKIKPNPFLPYASGLSYEVAPHPSPEARELFGLLSSPHMQGATIRRDEETGEIYIARVIHGGLADRSGLLHPGDLIVEVNGNPVVGLDPAKVIRILTNSTGTILFKVIPNSTQASSNQKPVYMRAMVDYCPRRDSSIPCPDAGMSFSRGDLLEVVDQTDAQWWQARKLPCGASFARLIPSASTLKRCKQREHWWCQPLHTHTCMRPRKDSSKITYDPTNKHMNRTVPSAGFRRSFHVWKRTSYKRRRQSCSSCSPNSSALATPYEEVVLYQRPPQENHRLIMLVGASGVGVNKLRKRLIKLNPSTFQGPVPHTTRPMREGEQMGREYHFVTKELFEYMVCNNRFVEYGENKGHLYGTSFDSIDEVLKHGRMCIVDAESHSIPLLRTRKLKPFVIFIKPPSPERLRQTRRNATIMVNDTEEDFVELEEVSRLIEAKYKQFFDSILVNDGLQDACMKLCSVIHQAQNEPQWIPVSWILQQEE
uniref:Membrane protein, palmitoylated 4a (MAGUK p55 subfamily member 4) n=1 Tax=Oryzias latipes TaxID=8090 RepID=A0A3B3HC35_ORYLA